MTERRKSDVVSRIEALERDMRDLREELAHRSRMLPYMSVSQAARALGVQKETIYRAINAEPQHRLRARMNGNGRWVIKEEDLIEWMESR